MDKVRKPSNSKEGEICEGTKGRKTREELLGGGGARKWRNFTHKMIHRGRDHQWMMMMMMMMMMHSAHRKAAGTVL
jgi:hypothetical protein